MTESHPLKRRDFLRGAAGVALASGMAAAGGAAPEAKAYVPAYFTPAEWAFINAAVDRLIPDDGNGPGGVAAGVPVFLDKQMQLPYGYGAYWYMQGPFHPEAPPTLGYQLRQTPRELYRAGIALIDRAAAHAHGKPFAQLDAAQRDALLTQADGGHLQEDGTMAAAFFALLLRNTREGFFADPIYGGNKQMAAWKMVGFPGARADFTDFIDQQGRKYPYGPVSIDGSRG
ncbi:gluconate 2-dehydrogenase subunit 3 family protein [Pseudoduganella sp. FT25W]|uniref:Gluconate 2-dehydrogenase subunit 3 family protein n=1 Tax=Duganella alba TaxID=2666081 RepID=A0A6L5QKC4_9BURK|nr:gluconate 2-dehydrogenase subunit 3 family protein [Duganella alba]MRX10117.1 gluconate 2-dehydrogenase subunit 3 family protein [Duganella alba]MRX16695.1 gluconate 2-dehydrogenase subunit 3 family protein [Duganella alba]